MLSSTHADLLAQIITSTNPYAAFNSIQVQRSSLRKDTGGYILLNFSEPLDDELQAVLIYSCDLPRVMELCVAVGIPAMPAYEALRQAAQN